MEDIYTYNKSTLVQPDRSFPPIDDMEDVDPSYEMESLLEEQYMRELINKKANEKVNEKVNESIFKEIVVKEPIVKKKVVVVKKTNIVMPIVEKKGIRQFNPRLPVPVSKNNNMNEKLALDMNKDFPTL